MEIGEVGERGLNVRYQLTPEGDLAFDFTMKVLVNQLLKQE